jgi:threonine aldolase
MKRLAEINFDKNIGYGHDHYCEMAREKIARACKAPDARVHFLVGGTQTNAIVIDSILRHNEGVVSPNTGHICTHEAGAIEACGHKVLPMDCKEGKISAQALAQYLKEATSEDYGMEHVVEPRMVYISNPTEYGTIYTLSELYEIRKVCNKYNQMLYIDGARLGYALAAEGNDVTVADLARLTDAFYIGGTEVGAMIGEAVVITNPAIAEDFRYIIKQRGAMLAKGWLMGVQFDVLMEDDLYFKIARHANMMADRIRDALRSKGYPIVAEDRTNQTFTIMPDAALEVLKKDFTFSTQERVDATHTMVRFCTSWGSTEESVNLLCEAIKNL